MKPENITFSDLTKRTKGEYAAKLLSEEFQRLALGVNANIEDYYAGTLLFQHLKPLREFLKTADSCTIRLGPTAAVQFGIKKEGTVELTLIVDFNTNGKITRADFVK